MTTAARPLDVIRQIVVIVAVCAMLAAAAYGTGAFGGTPVSDVQGGALDDEATYLAPGGPAFAIWSVIYAGLVAYAVWQALPRQRASERHRAMGWLVALTALLNAGWLMAAQFADLPVTVVAIVLLLVALAASFAVAVATRIPGGGVLDALLIDEVTGLHMGWVMLATVSNVTAWLTGGGPEARSEEAEGWSVAVVVLVGLVALAVAWGSRWRVAPVLAIGWGLAWIGIARLFDQPHSAAVGVTAIVVGAVVVFVALAVAVLRLLRPAGD